jgi:hypothetical protein
MQPFVMIHNQMSLAREGRLLCILGFASGALAFTLEDVHVVGSIDSCISPVLVLVNKGQTCAGLSRKAVQPDYELATEGCT